MTYLEAVELLKSIEEKYDVMSIRYKGMSVWPYLRLYLLDQISVKKEHMLSGSIVKVVIKSLFCYNPLKMFKRHDLWLFTGCERRKQIGDKMIHRISGGISASSDDCLMIEKPDFKKGHYGYELIEEKDIVSESWLLVLFHLFQMALRTFSMKIENEAVIQQVLADNNLTFDYRHYVRALNAKRLSLLCFLNITRKPKLAVMECPYDVMGYMWAFHQKGVKVVELQHGVAGASHDAYNAKAYEPRMNPDGICVFGSEEYKYFTEVEPQYAPKVYMTGLYMLEKADEYFGEDIFGDYRSKYDEVIVCSGQKEYEQVLSGFVDELSKAHPRMMFVYIPRLSDTELHFEAKNVTVARDVNIYQYLKWADVHITISSTTCLEAQYFHKPTIFYDNNKMATTYYGNLLKEENGAVYVSEAKDFNEAMVSLKQKDIKYLEVFAHNHIKKVMAAIKEMMI